MQIGSFDVNFGDSRSFKISRPELPKVLMRQLLRSAILISLAAPIIAVSCGGNSDVTDGGGLAGTGGVSGTGSVSGTGGSIVGQGGSVNEVACEGADDCAEGEVCHPSAQVCVTPGADCAKQTDCDTGESCDIASKTCLPGLTGSACAADDNCVTGTSCEDGICGCSGFSQEQEEEAGPLDIFFLLDRTGSMGQNCAYTHGDTPPRHFEGLLREVRGERLPDRRAASDGHAARFRFHVRLRLHGQRGLGEHRL